jgi:hypothetical protein
MALASLDYVSESTSAWQGTPLEAFCNILNVSAWFP